MEWGFQPPGPVPFLVGGKVYTRTIVKEIWEIVYNIEDQTSPSSVANDTSMIIINNPKMTMIVQPVNNFAYFL